MIDIPIFLNTNIPPINTQTNNDPHICSLPKLVAAPLIYRALELYNVKHKDTIPISSHPALISKTLAHL